MKSLVFILVFGMLLHFHPTVVSPRPHDYTERRILCQLDYVRAVIHICGAHMWTAEPPPNGGPYLPPPEFLAMYDDRSAVKRNTPHKQWTDEEIINAIDEYLEYKHLQYNAIGKDLAQNRRTLQSRSPRFRRRTYKKPLSKKCCSIGCSREDFRGYCFL